MTIQDYFGDWIRVVDINEAERLVKLLAKSNKPICPLLKDVFKAFRICHMDKLKVVIIAQDPYSDFRNGKPVATGIAFANPVGTPSDSYSPSLEILRDSIIDFTVPHRRINFDCSLEKLEEQGVLMLNSALSCISGSPGSHALLWRPFMKTFLTNLSRQLTGIVYVLMGSSAQSLEPFIELRNNHVIRIRHPAYYARMKEQMPSDIWREIDDILISKYGYGIQWYEEY